MAAVAHSFDDDEPIDPAEEPMPAADFRIIERAHAVCGHAMARELTAEHDLIAHAAKILSAQIRALALSAKATENIQNSYKHAADVLDDFGDDEPDEPVDWQQVAANAWNEGWRAAAVEYQVTRRNAYAWVRR
jgi:hypothetical protein